MCTFQYRKVHSFCVCCYEEGRYNVVSQPNFITPFLMRPRPCRGHGWNWRRMTMEQRVEDGGDLTLLRFVWCGDQGLVFGSCRQAEFMSKQA